MECSAYCEAAAFHVKPLLKNLNSEFKANLIRDVIHLEVPHHEEMGHAFFFPFGASVYWNVREVMRLKLQEEVKAYSVGLADQTETDDFTYIYGDVAKVQDDEIVLSDDDPLTKLAISYGIAQSVKLSTFEAATEKTFNKTRQIPEDLAKKGEIPLSRKEIRKKMGELFIERSSITLHVDTLDTPEFFWEYPELDHLYRMIANYLDIETRVEVLNHRLEVVHELFQMLGGELNHQHSSRLEWTIIILIIIEVVLTLMKDVFKVL